MFLVRSVWAVGGAIAFADSLGILQFVPVGLRDLCGVLPQAVIALVWVGECWEGSFPDWPPGSQPPLL